MNKANGPTIKTLLQTAKFLIVDKDCKLEELTIRNLEIEIIHNDQSRTRELR